MFPSHPALQERSTMGLDDVKHKRLIFDMVSVSVTPLETPEDWERNCKVIITCNRPGPMWGNVLDLICLPALEWLAHSWLADNG
jgi:hypothetical protein